jgi:uncharacterized HhH-GPD family protein
MAGTHALRLTGDRRADRYVSATPLALLIGMVLAHQSPLERAFAAPYELSRRLRGDLTAATVARLPREQLDLCFRKPPALHRCPGVMAGRVHALCTHLVVHHRGDPTAVWRAAGDGRELLAAVRALPGVTAHRARILVALLGKQLGVRPPGWERAAGPYALPGHRSVADVTDRESLALVRTYTREHRRVGA